MANPEKFILDATAGFRMMWFNKKHPNCIFLDQRPECEPDIVGDFRDLKQFPDETFRLVVFDPQHRRVKDGCPKGFIQSYGALLPETWQSDFKKAFAEVWRCLKPYGILIFKWSSHKIKEKSVLQCFFPYYPLFGQKTTGSKGNRKSKTFWFCFMKIPKEADQIQEALERKTYNIT